MMIDACDREYSGISADSTATSWDSSGFLKYVSPRWPWLTIDQGWSPWGTCWTSWSWKRHFQIFPGVARFTKHQGWPGEPFCEPRKIWVQKAGRVLVPWKKTSDIFEMAVLNGNFKLRPSANRWHLDIVIKTYQNYICILCLYVFFSCFLIIFPQTHTHVLYILFIYIHIHEFCF